MRDCSIPGCPKPAKARGWCNKHYEHWRIRGVPVYTPPTPEERFWSNVDKTGPVPEGAPHLGPCWLWLITCSTEGYGHVTWRDGRTRKCHQVAYELLVGPIPEGLTLDHLCRVRRCVNPSHLEPVTQRENLLRGMSPIALVLRTGYCKRGHEFTDENTYWTSSGRRQCRTCIRLRSRPHWRQWPKTADPGADFQAFLAHRDAQVKAEKEKSA